MKTDLLDQFLSPYINREKFLHQVQHKEFKIDHLRSFVESHPDLFSTAPILHVAGSKGKGSVCHLLANGIQKLNQRVGLFTSPHLLSTYERIQLFNADDSMVSQGAMFPHQISESFFIQCRDRFQDLVSSEEMSQWSYFELLTMFSMFVFREAECDVIVLETGLGGRLDSTNVFNSLFAIITSIELEHTHLLGDTLAKIGKEKIAIVKESTKKCFALTQVQEVEEVFERHCKQKHVPLEFIKCSQSEDYRRMNVDLTLAGIRDYCSEMNLSFDNSLADELMGIQTPGRNQKLNDKPRIIFDGAHTPQSIENILRTHKSNDRLVILFAAHEGKNIQEMLDLLSQYGDRIILTDLSDERAYSFVNENNLNDKFEYIPCPNQALEKVLENLHSTDTLLMTGSFYLLSEVYEQLCTSIKV